MFTQGFEKTAGISMNPAKLIGQTAKGVSTVTKGITTGVSNLLARGKAARMEGYRGAGKETGGNLMKSRARTNPLGNTAEGSAKTRIDVAKRMRRMQDYKSDQAAKNKQSFASKHPLLTAGGLYLGARAAFGGDKKEQSPQQSPQVYAPQY